MRRRIGGKLRVSADRQICLHALSRFHFGVVLILASPGFSSSWASTQSDEPAAIEWLTGKKLDTALRLAVSGDIQSAPIRQRLTEFAERQGIGIFLDRRVDPNIELNLSFVELTVEQFLWKLTDQCGLGVCRFGDVFYVGPLETARALPLLHDQLRDNSSKLSRARKGPKWSGNSVLAWTALAEPRMLVDQLCEANDIRLSNPALIPHDLWPECQLPPMALDERLALLVVGFNLWLERNQDGDVKLIPLPVIDEGKCTVHNVEDAAQVARALRSEFIDSKFVASGKSIKMTGSTDALWKARRWLVNRQRPELGKAEDHVFSIETTASRGGILASVATQINCQLSYPPSAKQILAEMVTIKMVQQPVDAIIVEVLKGTQLTYHIEGSQLLIKP